ncbi:MAG: hydantoinase/oxoprolinase family protein, partial [Chloroflexi bacterium]|nr:hydantoinase/oxoprolinase family protein [Chloroflexota bacterium]
YFCGGTMIANMEAVNTALDKLSKKLNITRHEAAQGIVRIANNNMVNAIKLISVNRGHDPRDFTLIAFGGGGGMHACALAHELNIKKVIIPAQSGVFSAWGMLLSDLRRDYLQTQIVELSKDRAAAEINETLLKLEKKALKEYADEQIDTNRVHFIRLGRCRYQNQEHFVEINLPDGEINEEKLKAILESFHEDYEREYTYRLNAPVELICYHLIAIAEVDKLQPQKGKTSGKKVEDAIKEKRNVDFIEHGIHLATIYASEGLEPGMKLVGPAIIEDAGTTIVIPPDLPCQIDDYGNFHIRTAQ